MQFSKTSVPFFYAIEKVDISKNTKKQTSKETVWYMSQLQFHIGPWSNSYTSTFESDRFTEGIGNWNVQIQWANQGGDLTVFLV